MSRWHKSWCQTPDVFVGEDQPRCRACNSIAPQPEVMGQLAPPKALAAPPDESAGSLKLWWPSSIPYSPTLDEELGLESPNPTTTTTVGQDPSGGQRRELVVRPAVPAENPVYGEALGPDEFRLLCLHSAPDADYPVHLSLETFRHDDCPEYETVSYTWGGESEDSTPCRPVYIGPFWDITLQTKNCWDLLRHLRPWRGIRMVWVDAICIDQANVSERNQQVAKMNSIYEQALRVVVYLGSDLADGQDHQETTRRTHRPRHRLLDLETKLPPQSGVSWAKLLQRRYFTRIWVVQELILARSSVFPIMGMDFSADTLDLDALEPGYDSLSDSGSSDEDDDADEDEDEDEEDSSTDDDTWSTDSDEHSLSGSEISEDDSSSDEDDNEETSAGNGEDSGEETELLRALREHSTSLWFRRLGGGPRASDDLVQLMRDTKYCDATDPRDKVYGLLGLINDRMRGGLDPDYGISVSHTLIGITAYLLIRQKQVKILLDCCISEDRGLRPSWVPDWQSLWRAKESPRETVECLVAGPSLKYRFPKRHTITFSTHPSRHYLDVGLTAWDKGAQISPSTGALSLTLVHLAHIEGCRTRRIRRTPESSVIMFQAWTKRVMFCLRTSDSKCHTFPRLPPGRIDLFHINVSSRGRGLLLFMRKQTVQRLRVSYNGYELLWCCGYASLSWSLCRRDLELEPTLLEVGPSKGLTESPESPVHSAAAAPPVDQEPGITLSTEELTISLGETLGSVRARAWARCAWRDIADRRPSDEALTGDEDFAAMAQLFPGHQAVMRELLPIFQILLGCSKSRTSVVESEIIDAYKQSFREGLEKYHPKIDHPHVIFTIDGEDEDVLSAYEKRMPESFFHWQWLPDSTTAKSPQWQKARQRRFWGSHARVKLRLPLVTLKAYLRTTPVFRALVGLKSQLVRETTGESEYQFMQRESTDEDFKKLWRPWPREVVDAFGADGVPQQVLIL